MKWIGFVLALVATPALAQDYVCKFESAVGTVMDGSNSPKIFPFKRTYRLERVLDEGENSFVVWMARDGEEDVFLGLLEKKKGRFYREKWIAHTMIFTPRTKRLVVGSFFSWMLGRPVTEKDDRSGFQNTIEVLDKETTYFATSECEEQ